MDIVVFGDEEDTDGLGALIDQGLDGFGGFCFENGVLMAEKVPLTDIAAQVGTPCYIYSHKVLVRGFQRMLDCMSLATGMKNTSRICYAVKANSNQAVLKILASMDAGADVVSLGEMERALAAGIPAEKIVFSGVGKTSAEISRALAVGIGQINVESEPELENINRIAGELGVKAPIAVRVNPDVDAETHPKITTGKRGNKFGIDLSVARSFYQKAAALPHIKVQGIAVHIGSQLVDLAPFRRAYEKLAETVRLLREDGHKITHIDLGGGIGVRYRHENPISLIDYAEMVADIFGDFGVELIVEPGRSIVGPAGVLLTEVLYVKQDHDRKFVIIDAGMNDLMRPALYDAWHDIVRVTQSGADQNVTLVDVVGPVCETADVFATDRPLILPKSGDLLAIGTAGAYGAVMASTYNSRPLVPKVMVKGDQFFVIRPRQTIDALIAADKVPAWSTE